ncbi:MAG: sulfotransferase domain-containing protein [Jatrophihabitans sp.]|uniref:sulfotransferase domain-containing protein n=1 Tax=Jatrophihabitans sp. TaxID=1932789 RepID=UPI003F7FD867
MSARPAIGNPRRPVIRLGRNVIRGFGMATARWRPDPEFLVIGGKRTGSTAFFYDLLEHPSVSELFPRPDRLPKATATKGIHYFDQNYFRSERWYRSYLPSERVRRQLARRTGGRVITGEASPYYLFHPAAAERAAAMLPEAKIIVLLRDPVERTYSHWKERRRADAEPLSFAEALEAEETRLAGVDDARLADPSFYSYAHEQQSYVRQSEYDVALGRWLERYPRDRVLVLRSEDYYRDGAATLATAQQFLGLPVRAIGSASMRNAAEGAPLDPALRARLAAHFAPHNERLEQLTGMHFNW